jgi:hypothetical protein
MAISSAGDTGGAAAGTTTGTDGGVGGAATLAAKIAVESGVTRRAGGCGTSVSAADGRAGSGGIVSMDGGAAAAARVGGAATAGTGAGLVGRPAPPWERSAAARVISREPQPGQVTTLSGPGRRSMDVLQRGQFMANRRASIS